MIAIFLLSSCCIHHSDRGVRYVGQQYVALLEAAHMKISMSRTANPYDNAHMEPFFKTLRYEEVHLANYETFYRAQSTRRFVSEILAS